MRVKRLISISAGVVLAAAIVFSAAYAAERGAKSLFYDPNAAGTVQINPGQPGATFTSSVKSTGGSGGSASPVSNYYDTLNPGVMYWIELVRPGGGITRVSNDRVFRTGDQIRIHVTTNSDGYLHVMHKGSTGNIVPVALNGNGEVKMGTDYVVPANGGFMKFDSNPGQEKLNLVFASIKSSDEVLNVMKVGASVPDQVMLINSRYANSPNRVMYTESGSKDLFISGGQPGGTQPVQYQQQMQQIPSQPQYAPAPAPATFNVAASFNVGGNPNFNVEPAVYNAPANYAVSTAPRGAVKEPVVIEITLNHHP